MPATKAEMAATNRYKKKNYKRVVIELRFEQYDNLKAVCDGLSMPVGTFAKQAVLDRLQKIAEEQQKLDDLNFSMTEN